MIFLRIRLAGSMAALALAASQTAQAGDDAALLDRLLCRQPDNPVVAEKASSELDARGRKLGRNGDNGRYVEGPIRSGDVCVEHATASAAFGVMMASASICDGKNGPLEAYLTRNIDQLRPRTELAVPGVIKAFEAGAFSIVLFHGAPDIVTGLDPASSTISYMCTLRVSGPQ